MEDNGEGVDDQGSGWLEVKKKHRSSSKFSLQRWVGGLSGGSQHSLNQKGGSLYSKSKTRVPNAGENFDVHKQGSVADSTLMSKVDEGGLCIPDKCVVGSECSKSPLIIINYNNRTDEAQEVLQKVRPDVVHKIKWGDLEDDSLVQPNDKTTAMEIKVGDIGNDNPVSYTKHGDDSELTRVTQETNLVTTSVNVNTVPSLMPAVTNTDDVIEDDLKEMDVISSEDLEMQSVDGKLVYLDDDTSNDKEVHTKPMEPINSDNLGSSSLSIEQSGIVNIEAPVPSTEGDTEIPEGPLLIEDSSTVVISQDIDLLPSEMSTLENIEKSMLVASTEDNGYMQDCIMHNDMPKAQIINALGEGDAGESKERYRQRLWCFLFENLNRAVDELYLLCELECDEEQMKEALIVLEEAASDFRELNSRVEEFENVKMSSSQSRDGMPIPLKTDHRRPHALSWEVRRMTTSPHRADILSSSLEAFKKVQQERASMHSVNDAEVRGLDCANKHHISVDNQKKSVKVSAVTPKAKDSVVKPRNQSGGSDLTQVNLRAEKRNVESGKLNKMNVQLGRLPQSSSSSDVSSTRLPLKHGYTASVFGMSKREHVRSVEKMLPKNNKLFVDSTGEKNSRSTDQLKKHTTLLEKEKEKEKRNAAQWKSMDAWKEKRNWEDILSTPFRVSSRISHSPGMSRKSAERARVLRDKLMSPEKKKKTTLDLKRDAEEKHARAMRIRSELENERVQKLQRTSEKLNRVNEWQAVRSMKLREGMYARHQRSESRHEAFLAKVVRRAGDESSKVNEVRFITSLNEENKKHMLRQKFHDSELRRAEKLLVIKTKQKEDIAREEAVLERKKLIEAEKLQRLAEIQRKKEEAQVRREEERRASSAAREARTTEQLRRKEERAKAQQEEAELLAQKLAERLSESEQRRKFYLEQIRERAAMDFRDQSSPLLRRSMIKDGQGRSTPTNSGEYGHENSTNLADSTAALSNVTLHQSLKRRIKRIRQRLMALKFEYPEPLIAAENAGIGYRTAVGTARVKIGRWLQELQRLRQARKEGAASIGLITAEMIKFMEEKDPELQASRQVGLLDFIASALPASHTSKPEVCQVTIHLLKLLRVALYVPANRSYFIAQNLLPPIIPMLSAALENYTKIAALLNVPGSTDMLSTKTSVGHFESISEILDGFLWTVTRIIGYISSDKRQLQMRDGLVELLVTYQVIHRLRDLFALYDRPQVEGSPFPSSIVLSVYLLVVLTTRPGVQSSIDWEYFPIRTVLRNENLEAPLVEYANCEDLSLITSDGDDRSPISVVNDRMVVTLSDVPKDRALQESYKRDTNGELVSIRKDCEKEPTDSSAGLLNVYNCQLDVSDESHKIINKELNKPCIPQKDDKQMAEEQKNGNILNLKQPVDFLLSSLSETGLVNLPSLLTSVLLQANNKLSSEQASYILPSNFEEVATGVLKVLNNMALLDISFMQKMLARPDLKMEFFHLMSFLLSHCTSKWKVATDQVGLLLLECLSILGHFALFHPGNQAVLRWGKSPTILHKVCDLPFVFFSDPYLMPILAGTLVATCYGCEQNKGVVQQELSMDMLLSLLQSCRSALPAVEAHSHMDNPTENSSDDNQLIPELKRPTQTEIPLKSSRNNVKNTRVSFGRGGALGNMRGGKMRSQRETKATKSPEETALKHNHPASETTSVMLHCRFPTGFIDKAEQFFSIEICNTGDRV